MAKPPAKDWVLNVHEDWQDARAFGSLSASTIVLRFLRHDEIAPLLAAQADALLVRSNDEMPPLH